MREARVFSVVNLLQFQWKLTRKKKWEDDELYDVSNKILVIESICDKLMENDFCNKEQVARFFFEPLS